MIINSGLKSITVAFDLSREEIISFMENAQTCIPPVSACNGQKVVEQNGWVLKFGFAFIIKTTLI